ncbi:MAG: two-component regulator propeller domain-containing protein [Bacteroidota bacterium]|nr:two-component regulator propeller domain-containing protein [Bacteroidota bacterium]
MNKNIILLLLLFIIGTLSETGAQNNNLSPHQVLIQFNIDNWDIQDGLPTNSLIDICQTQDGYIWISSYEGLIRFDGIQFKVFDSSNTPEFKDNGIGEIEEDSKGVLWITTQNSGLIALKDKKFTAYGPKQGITHISPIIYIDSKDRIRSSTKEGGWFIFENGEFKFLPVYNQYANADLQTVTEKDDGTFILGTAGNGILHYKADGVTAYTTNDGLESNWIRSSFNLGGDSIMIGTDEGACIFTGGRFFPIPELKCYSIDKIIKNNAGDLWFATTQGLIRKSHKTDTYEFLNSKSGLSHNHTDNLLWDKENSLWVINYKAGLTRLKAGKFISYSDTKGLNGTIVNTVCEYKPGNILVGFDNGYINRIKNGTISEFKTKKNLIGSRVRHIFKDSQNNLWISTYAGLLKITEKGNEQWFSESIGFPGKYIRHTFEDSNHNIWVGTRNSGLIKIKKDGSYVVFNKQKGLGTNMVMATAEDKDGNILVGTSRGGLNIIQNEQIIQEYTKKDGLTGDIIFNITPADDGYTWVASKGGLNCLKDGKLTGFSTKENFIHAAPYDVLEDSLGYLWMPTSIGVMKINKQDLLDFARHKTRNVENVLYSKESGIKQKECTSTAQSIITDKGNIWFPTVHGVITINPNNIQSNPIAPEVHIEEVLSDQSKIKLSENISINSGHKRLTINYTALSFLEPESVLFKYKLEGYNRHWSSPLTDRTVSYTNLPPGKYTFIVIAANNDGVWNTKGAEIEFTIKPQFYQTLFFYFFVGIVFLTIIYFAYKFNIRRLKNKQHKLETIIQERTQSIREKNNEIALQNDELKEYQNSLEKRIKDRTKELETSKTNAEKADQLKTSFLENLSHEVRTPLNAIVGFSTILKEEKNLSEQGFECIEYITKGSHSLTKIIDSIVQASQIQLGDIKLKQTNFSITELLQELQSDFEILPILIENKTTELILKDDKVQNISITTDRVQLRIILFNLIENALKYTKKGTVEYGAIVKDDVIHFYIEDTGIGIAKENVDYIFDRFRKIDPPNTELYRGLGLGLDITKRLVELLDGKIDVQTVQGKGSVFTVDIPAKDKKGTLIKESVLKKSVNTNKEILIVEDDLMNLLFLKTFLSKLNFNVYVAQNGMEAVNLYKKHPEITLILMDIKMPVMDGYKAVEKIRTFDKNVSIVAQTAYAFDYQKEKILERGFDDYIKKPIDINILRQLLSKY